MSLPLPSVSPGKHQPTCLSYRFAVSGHFLDTVNGVSRLVEFSVWPLSQAGVSRFARTVVLVIPLTRMSPCRDKPCLDCSFSSYHTFQVFLQLTVMYVAMIDICGLVFVWTRHFSQVDTKDNKQQNSKHCWVPWQVY